MRGGISLAERLLTTQVLLGMREEAAARRFQPQPGQYVFPNVGGSGPSWPGQHSPPFGLHSAPDPARVLSCTVQRLRTCNSGLNNCVNNFRSFMSDGRAAAYDLHAQFTTTHALYSSLNIPTNGLALSSSVEKYLKNLAEAENHLICLERLFKENKSLAEEVELRSKRSSSETGDQSEEQSNKRPRAEEPVAPRE